LKRFHGLRILAVMPKDPDGHILAQIAARAKWYLEFARSYESARELAARHEFAIILCDRDLPLVASWREAIPEFASLAPDSRIMLTSPVNDDHLWQEVIQRGGYDVLTKPFKEERVVRSINFAWSSANNSFSNRIQDQFGSSF
jgi:DNA-binding NtrC family response regulator